jgi:hypothetical protein
MTFQTEPPPRAGEWERAASALVARSPVLANRPKRRAAVPAERSAQYLPMGVVLLVAGLSVICFAGPALHGDPSAIGRGALGVLGMLAGGLFPSRPAVGWRLAQLWALLQIPFVAWGTDGALTTQVVSLPVTLYRATAVDYQAAPYSAFGINFVGLLFTLWLGR